MDTMTSARRPERGADVNPWAAGLAVFAALMLMTTGVLQALQGIAAIIDDEFFVVVAGYPYGVDVSSWGWIHLVVGIVVAVVGFFVLTGAGWARATGIFLAALSILANFLFIPYYPLWSVLLIALGVAVIWALAVYSPPSR